MESDQILRTDSKHDFNLHVDYPDCYATEWISPKGVPQLWIRVYKCVCVHVCVSA